MEVCNAEQASPAGEALPAFMTSVFLPRTHKIPNMERRLQTQRLNCEHPVSRWEAGFQSCRPAMLVSSPSSVSTAKEHGPLEQSVAQVPGPGRVESHPSNCNPEKIDSDLLGGHKDITLVAALCEQSPAMGSLLGALGQLQAAAFRASCLDLARSSCDVSGRLITGEVVTSSSKAVHLFGRVSPCFLRRLSISGVTSAVPLREISRFRCNLENLREVHLQLGTPLRLLASESSRAQLAREVAEALTDVLPAHLETLDLDLKSGCLCAGHEGLERICASAPPGLKRLNLALNQVNSTNAQVVAKTLPPSLRALSLHFHGRSLCWLGGSSADGQDSAAKVLASALPPSLLALRLLLECSDAGAMALCNALPSGLVDLEFGVRIRSQERLAACTQERLSQAIAMALPRLSNLRSLRLSLLDYFIGLEGVRTITRALPGGLNDLQLDLFARDVGNVGAEALAASMPVELRQLTLSLRSWRFTARGAKAIAHAMPRQLRSLKLMISSSPIGPSGVWALVASFPPELERLDLSLRICSVRPEGERILRELSQKWFSKPGSSVRVKEKLNPVYQRLDSSLERCDFGGTGARDSDVHV